ncbi:MAG: hypothetical protein WD963_01640 [Candidatus Paceibacterota bacterium]
MKKSRKTSFTEYDSIHIYELSLEHFQRGCFSCDKIKKRLEDGMSKKDIRLIKNLTRKNSYCK